jgi:peptidoglycan hydrolase-like protein with peptidoglycan-binding domain
VEQGDTGVLVETVQYLLNQAGASLTVDGNFGAMTAAAVESFQAAHGIEATGEVHGYTWPALVVTVQDGSTGDAVEAGQTLLNSVDDAGLTVDGNDGANTTAAVKAFQTKAKLTVDGVAGSSTWNALVNAALIPTPTPPTPTPTPTPIAGSAQENANQLAVFLMAHGYSANGAGGIITCCYGESALNPESVGDGGNGLIGWTPPLAGAVTGNASADLAFQMNALLEYNERNDPDSIATLNAQTSITAAADYYSQVFERPAVLDSDVHAEGITIATIAIQTAQE